MSTNTMTEVDVLDRIISKLGEVEALEKYCSAKSCKELMGQVKKLKEKAKGARDKSIRQYRSNG